MKTDVPTSAYNILITFAYMKMYKCLYVFFIHRYQSVLLHVQGKVSNEGTEAQGVKDDCYSINENQH